jgi:hypothetical protein
VEAGSACGGVLCPDLATVRLDERLGNGESQSCSQLFPVSLATILLIPPEGVYLIESVHVLPSL